MALTKNYYILRMVDMGVNYNLQNLTGFVGKDLVLRDINGNYITTINEYSNSTYYHSTKSYTPFRYWRYTARGDGNSCSAIMFGTSNNKESIYDYKISSFNADIYKYETTTQTVNENKTVITNTVTLSCINTSGNTQQIYEVGVRQDRFLIYRKVLETPLIVPNGGYFKITFTYSIPVTNNLLLKEEK